MLKLKNIKKSNGIISADYDPECSGEIGRISINIDSGKEVETTISLMDREFPIYLNHNRIVCSMGNGSRKKHSLL